MDEVYKEIVKKRIILLFEELRKHEDDDKLRAVILAEIIFLKDLLENKK